MAVAEEQKNPHTLGRKLLFKHDRLPQAHGEFFR
jgi:hypothetical protein